MLLILMGAVIFTVMFSNQLFGWCKWYRKLACKIGWHSWPNFDDVHKKKDDPLLFLTYAKCKWCGYEGQIDSQGNLF